jgi:hypothetical protein
VARRVIAGVEGEAQGRAQADEGLVILGRAIAETVVAVSQLRRRAERRGAAGHQPDPRRDALPAAPILGQIIGVEIFVKLAIVQIQRRIAQIDRNLGGAGENRVRQR